LKRASNEKISALLLLLVSVCHPALAQSSATPDTPAPGTHPGRELLQKKCFQCHSDAIWRDQRQDSRAWEATLYRMMGRGAVWSADEIKTMAAYLATDFGPHVPRAVRAAR